MKNNRQFLHEKPKFLVLAITVLICGALLLFTFMLAVDNPILCTMATSRVTAGAMARVTDATNTQLETILHYATSSVVPQQSNAEIRVSFDVLRTRTPCNFLVFGLGHDSRMWNAFNPGGVTLFLEEDPKWVQAVLKDAPNLQASTVQYRTKMVEADKLLEYYRSEPDCAPSKAFLRGNEKCKLALNMLPEEVYAKEWDLVMIDAPRGYFGEAPGRMSAIFSAAVMARNRKGRGPTHVFLHDVDRRVEKVYAEEFLCRKYLVNTQGRLWHFKIPAANTSDTSNAFC